MLRFDNDNRQAARNYTSRREQLRLLLLFVPLALVILLMARLRDPKVAEAVNNFFAPPAEQSAVEEPRPISVNAAKVENPALFPGVDVAQLKSIEDNTYFRTAEKDAWFHFFQLLRERPADASRATTVEYAQLVDQPDVYRGTLVTVHGTARQITIEKPAANDLGLTSYYRVVIQPADGANWPILVYCLELPSGVSPGDSLSLDVTARGLFFKKLSYKWRDGLGIAPVVVAKTVGTGGESTANVGDPVTETSARNARDESTPAVDLAVDAAKPQAARVEIEGQWAFRKILELDGWTDERLAKFDEGESLTDEQRLDALSLLRRLRRIDTESLQDWFTDLPLGHELKDANDVRGKLVGLVGRVTKVTRRALDEEDARRLEMPEYFECEMELQNLHGPTTVIAGRVPEDWLKGHKPYGASKTIAVFVKEVTDEAGTRTVWVAKEIAWFPGAPAKETRVEDLFRDARDPLLGKALLVSMDVGLLDLVEPRGRIRPQERSAFYQVLRAAGYIPPETLVRVANENLPAVKMQWERQQAAASKPQQQALAREVVRLADEGRYSVAMLFNEPEPQIGRVFVFDGIARRAVRVEVAGSTDGANSKDVAERYEFDHYFELEVFTNDSQNFPLVFCVRELPQDFPVGANIHVPVRIAGFFFKDWLYSTRGRPMSDESDDGKRPGPRSQYAPLLIGNAPIVLTTSITRTFAGEWVLGGLFVAALVGMWAAAVWFARDEQRFHERTSAARFELPDGATLDDLQVSEAER